MRATSRRDAVVAEHARGVRCSRTRARRAAGRRRAAPGGLACGVGGVQDGVGVALHEPRDRALRHLGVRAERAVLEVGVADEAHVVLAGAAAEPERVGAREAGEVGGVGGADSGTSRRSQVDVERGPVVERVDAVAGAAGHEQRVADAAPAVLDADPERRVGADRERRRSRRAGPRLRTAGRSCPRSLPAPPPTSGTTEPATSYAPRTMSRWLPARPSVQQQQRPVRPLGEVVDAGRDLGAGLAQPAGEPGRDGAGHGEALAAERHHHDALVARAARTDLARGRAADQRHVAGRDAVEHRLEIEASRSRRRSAARRSARPSTAAARASAPARNGFASADSPTPTQRAAVITSLDRP